MYSPTYEELLLALQKELDLEDETFITPDEFLSYFNRGVDEVEAAIHTIYEDYFLTNSPLSLVSGTQDYVLPTDIYAQKIRGIFYNDGTSVKYEIMPIRKIQETDFLEPTDFYKYIITNTSASGLRISVYPVPSETSTNIKIWYIRNAKRFEEASDVCDIPEFTHVIVQYARWKCLSKEGHPSTQAALMDYERMKVDMVDTLTARIPDENNDIIKDMSFYNDFDDSYLGGNY
jgi:hypothetical protein